MRSTPDVARDLQESLHAVYTNQLRARKRADGKWVLTVPQPTLEGGDVSLFINVVDGRVLLHDNGRTSLFLQTVGIDPRSGRTKVRMEHLAAERGCEYRLGRLEVSVHRGGDSTSAALGLMDAIKTVSDLGLQTRSRATRQRPIATQVRSRLLEWYEPSAVRAPLRVRGQVSEHVVEFAVHRGGRWCAVKPVEGREIMASAANWLGTWRDIWLGHSLPSNGNALVGAVSVYPTTHLIPAEVDVVKDILGRLGHENIAVPAESPQGYRDAIESVFRGRLLQ